MRPTREAQEHAQGEAQGADGGRSGRQGCRRRRDGSGNQSRHGPGSAGDRQTLQGFVAEHPATGAKVFTDDASAYEGLPFDHEAVCRSAGEYVRGMAHTNGVKSFWSMLKRGYHDTFHHCSEKHLDRYVGEFAGRHNDREADTIDMMGEMMKGLEGEPLRYRDLIA